MTPILQIFVKCNHSCYIETLRPRPAFGRPRIKHIHLNLENFIEKILWFSFGYLKKCLIKNLYSKKLWHFLNSLDRKVSVTIKLITGCLIKNGPSFSILCLLDHFSRNFLKPLALSWQMNQKSVTWSEVGVYSQWSNFNELKLLILKLIKFVLPH